jgi:acyl-CoA thioesterase-1
VRGCLNGPGESDYFDDWAGNRCLQISASCVSMIMAVPLKLMLWAAGPVAAFALLAGCGNQSESKPDRSSQAATSPPAPVASEPANDPNDTRPIIAAFGDSISAGFGVDPGKSYPDDLQKLIDAAGYKYRVVNMGVSGDTTTDALERLPMVLAIHPEIVILEFGGNDGLRGLPVASAKKNLEAVIQTLQAAHIKVLLAGMTLPRNYGPDYIKSFDEMYVDVARKYTLSRIPFVLEGVGGHPDLTQPDGIHPTAQGAVIVAQNVMKYLQSLLTRV